MSDQLGSRQNNDQNQSENEDELFTTREGTVDQGKDYEKLVVANLVLKMVTDPQIENFHISSNDEKFGDFDDVVIKLKKTGSEGTQNYALQLKHFENKKTGSAWINELKNPKGKLSLLKYFKTFKTQHDNVNRYKLILFTNIQCPLEDEKIKLEPNGTSLTLKTCQSQVDLLLKSAETNKCLKFKPSSVENDDLLKQFFEHFFIYSKQSNVHQLNREISKTLDEIVSAPNSPTCLSKYLSFIKNWMDSKGTKVKLNKSMMQKVFTLTFLDSYIHPVKFCNDKNSDLLQQIVLNFNYMVFSREVIEYIETISSDSKKYLENNKELVKKYQIKKDYQQDPLELSKLLWLMKKFPLIINTTNEIIFKIIKTFKCFQIVLVVNTSANTIPSSFLCFKNLSYLFQNDQLLYKNKALDNLEIKIANNSYKLKDLMRKETIKEFLTTDELVKMATTAYILEDTEEFLPQYYISRHLHTNLINFNHFIATLDSKTFLLITNVKDETQIRKYIQFYQNKFSAIKSKEDLNFIADNICFMKSASKNDFAKICTKYTNFKRFHHLRINPECEFIEWVESKGDLKDIQQFVFTTNNSSQSEETICQQINHLNNVNLICNEPGIGKTWLLKNLKNKLALKKWTVFMSSSEMNKFCHQSEGRDLNQFLLKTKYQNFHQFEQSMISFMLNHNDCIYFWDALDEVDSDNLETIIALIKDLSTNSKHFVTCRKHLQQMLEIQFCVLSQSITEFDEKELKSYLNQRLDINEDGITENILEYFKFVKANDFLGVPLQMFMLTELLQQDEEKYSKFLTKQLPVTELYNYFFEEKIKMTYKDNKSVFEERDLRCSKFLVELTLQKAALMTLCDKDFIAQLKINKGEVDKSMDIIEPYGIITKNEKNWRFGHQSYVDYFAACYFAEYFKEIDNLADVMFDPRYTHMRFFFDVLLAKNSEPHLSVIYHNFDKLKRYENLIECKDAGGRNLLHLHCSWGESYPVLNVKTAKQFFIFPSPKLIISDNEIEKVNQIDEEYFQVLNHLLKHIKTDQKDDLFKMTETEYAKRKKCLMAVACIIKRQNRRILETENCDFALSILYYSIRFGYDDMLKDELTVELLTNIELDSHLKTLLNLASSHGNLKIAEMLVQHGASVNEVTRKGATSLHEAAFQGHYETVKFLIRHKVDINCAKRDGSTALYIVSSEGNLEIAQLLLNNGANPNSADENGLTPLHKASFANHCKVAELLIDKRANVNAANKDGWTPLHFASSEGHSEIAELLINRGANVNAVTKEGATSLHEAAFKNHIGIARILIQQEVNIKAVKKGGSTALSLASSHRHYEIVELLKYGSNTK